MEVASSIVEEASILLDVEKYRVGDGKQRCAISSQNYHDSIKSLPPSIHLPSI